MAAGHYSNDSIGLDAGPVTMITPIRDEGTIDIIAKLEARIDALEAKLSSNPTVVNQNNAPSPRAKADKLKNISKQHNKRAKIAKSLRLLFLLIVTSIVFGYEYYLYSDPQQNKLSQSAIVRINEIDIPYIYIYGGGLTNLSIPFQVRIQNGQFEPEVFSIVNKKYTHDLVYDASFMNWTFIDITEPNAAEQALLVPPFGATLPIGSSLSVYLRSIWDNPTFKDTDFEYQEELLQKLSQGKQFGLYWDIGPISDMKQIENTKLRYIDQWQQLQYTFIATLNYYYIDLFEEINKINNSNAVYYTATLVASILNDEKIYYNYGSDHWYYDTELILYPNPTGGGLKTTLTITQKTTFTDVLSNVGGIFSPLNTFTFLILLWTVFGFHSSRFQLHGVAPLSSLDYVTRQQIKMYLVHLGIICDDELHVDEAKDMESKMLDLLK